ncbi:MAG TPA: histidine kinase [Burkholderiaceae bacterium]
MTAANPTLYQRWQTLRGPLLRYFHLYAGWLVSISWRRFVLLAVAAVVGANLLEQVPPFSLEIPWGHYENSRRIKLPKPPALKPVPKAGTDKPIHYEVTIDDKGLRIEPRAPAGAASDSVKDLPSINIGLPHDIKRDELQQVIDEAKKGLEDAVRESQDRAARDTAEAVREAYEAAQDALDDANEPVSRTRYVKIGGFLGNLALLLVLSSAVIKAMYKGRIQAEVKAAQAAETAEAESLKRQVIEARMAAMQAQVEPHFLFNTLASIDHLIETDPPRASQMQKNLIALLRASMPTMREANANGKRDLGRELAVIRPYLEILKVRMEERLQTEIDVPDGLLSAEFPPMMIQSLVENAIKHGLEPKAEGGSLKLKAEVVHGKLSVTVADTGLGFGRAATGGTGVGLANIRERLGLLCGAKASLTVTENQPSGTIVTIQVPYRSRDPESTDQGAKA